MKKSNDSAGIAHTFLTSAQTLCIITDMNVPPCIVSIFILHTSHKLQHDSSTKFLTSTESQESLISGFMMDCSHLYLQHITASAK